MKYQISFSGGRTSAFMTKMLLDKYSDKYDFIVTFANTGLEHERTLEFINNCDKHLGFNTVWLEAVVSPEKGSGTTHKVVTFETASRNGEPFEDVVRKYGIPNPSYLHCTRELKLQVMHSYLRSLGIKHTEIITAIGIREDETRRMNKKYAEVKITYPLIFDFPTDKQDVLAYWAKQSFDLGIEEWDGNCKGCYKKSFKKIFKQLDSDPSILDFHIKMERLYPRVGNRTEYIELEVIGGDGEKLTSLTRRPDRVFFRGNTSASDLRKMWENYEEDEDPQLSIFDGFCSESCEVYN